MYSCVKPTLLCPGAADRDRDWDCEGPSSLCTRVCELLRP